MVLDLQLDNLYLLEKALFSLQDGIAILDKNAIIVYINKEGQDLFKRKSHRFPSAGSNYLSFVSTNNLTLIESIIGQGFEGNTITTTLSFPLASEARWYELTVFPIKEDTLTINHVCLKARNITDKVILEKQLEYQRQTERRKILKATLDAQEKERAEIGQELHDNINQTLTTVKLYNEIILDGQEQDKSLLAKSITILNNTISEIRQLSRKLASPNAITLSLKDLISDLAESINIMHKVQVNFQHKDIEDLSLPRDFKIGIFRIIQEQLTNTLKHANASHIIIQVINDNEQLSISMIDNGIGFNLESNKKGIGLLNMHSRTEALGGSITIQSNPGKGCRLSLIFNLTNGLK